MKNTKCFFLTTSVIILFLSCNQPGDKQNETTLENKDTANTQTVKAKEFNFYVAGYLTDNDDKTVALLGPKNQKWIIQKSDIVQKEAWSETYTSVKGSPDILTIKFGSTIITENGNLTVGKEIKDINDPDVVKGFACNCQVSCGDRRFCCAINGLRTYCAGGGTRCVQTTERC